MQAKFEISRVQDICSHKSMPQHMALVQDNRNFEMSGFPDNGTPSCIFFPGGGGGRGGLKYKKGRGMLVVLLRGVNFRFWSRLGC